MTKISCVYCPLKESIRDVFVIQCPGQKRFRAQFGSRFWGEGVVSFLGDPRKMPGNGSAVVALVSARAALNNRRSSVVVDSF